MAQVGYIMVKSFEGTSNRSGHPKGSTILYSLRTAVDTPIDVDHHAVVGKRHHEAVVAEIGVDASAYQYFNAVIDKDRDGAKKLDVEFGLFRQNQENIGLWGAGENAPYYVVQLTDAFIGDVDFVMSARETNALPTGPMAGRTPGDLQTDRLIVKLYYRKIEWTFKQGNKAAEDAWNG